MAKAARTRMEIEHLKARQEEIAERLGQQVSAYFKDGTKISGRCVGLNSHNNAEVALRTGQWEFYSESTIRDHAGNLSTIDLMTVRFFV